MPESPTPTSSEGRRSSGASGGPTGPASPTEPDGPGEKSEIRQLMAQPQVALMPRVHATPASKRRAEIEQRGMLAVIRQLAHVCIARKWDTGILARDPADAHLRQNEVLGLLGEHHSQARAEVSRAWRGLEAALADLAMMTPEQTPNGAICETPLAQLAREQQLSPLACWSLLAASAPLLDGELRKLYTRAMARDNRTTCDEAFLRILLWPLVGLLEIALAPPMVETANAADTTDSPAPPAMHTRANHQHPLQWIGITTTRWDDHASTAAFARIYDLDAQQRFVVRLAAELDAVAPLRACGLLTVSAGTRPNADLQPDAAVLQVLQHRPWQATGLTLRSSAKALPALFLPAALVRAALQYATHKPRQGQFARIVVRGRTGSGRRSLLASLAQLAHRTLAQIDVAAFPRDTEDFATALAQLLRRAAFSGCLPCVSGLDLLLASDDGSLRDAVVRVLNEHAGPLALRLPTASPVPLAPGYGLLDIPPASERARVAMWAHALRNAGASGVDTHEIARHNRLGPGIINQVCDELAVTANASANARDVPSHVTVERLQQVVAQHLETQLTATATRIKRLASLAEVVLPDDLRETLVEFTARVRHRQIVYEKWAFDRKITTARGVTALFTGVPGTGKTMVAGALARDLGLDLYRVDVARIASKWIGETEKNLAALFDAAEEGQVLLLFDECDSLFAKRTEVKTSVDRHANMQVNYLLQRLDSFDGVAILTTNFGNSLDPAFRRRLSYRIAFPFPDESMRAELWRSLLPKDTPRDASVDCDELGRRWTMSGGYIRNAALRAAFIAAQQGADLHQAHIEQAIAAEFAAAGKLSDSGTLE